MIGCRDDNVIDFRLMEMNATDQVLGKRSNWLRRLHFEVFAAGQELVMKGNGFISRRLGHIDAVKYLECNFSGTPALAHFWLLAHLSF